MNNELVKNVSAIDTSELASKTDYNVKIKDIKDKIPSITNLATNVALTAVGNTIPREWSNQKIDHNAKIKEIDDKYFTKSDYNKFTDDTLNAKIKIRN